MSDSSSLVRLFRPRVWHGGAQPTYAVAIQPSHDDAQATTGHKRRRTRVATASGDKTLGVCIWDLDELLSSPSDPFAASPSVPSPSVKLERGSSGSSRRGLLAALPNHLSAVNVVRWEPTLGERLASGSDMNTQSIIIWKRKEATSTRATDDTERKEGDDDEDDDADEEADSSQPYGLRRQDSGPTLGGDAAVEKLPPNRECWVPALSLHGQSDIQDLCWGPLGLHFPDETDGIAASSPSVGLIMDSPSIIASRLAQGIGSRVLASCSLDTSVVVWNTTTGDRHTLKGHSGWAVGLAFDPLGAVLATQSSDGFVWIWSTATFQLLRKMRAVGLPGPTAPPRTDVHRTVSMARMSWTPDGAALVCCRGELPRRRKGGAHAVRHVSVVLNRKRNFAAQCVFGGHNDRTTVSAFSPVLFKVIPTHGASAAAPAPSFFGVLAIGSHDRSVSVWSTRSSRPLLLLAEVCEESILDLAWSHDGRTLIVAAHDGAVVVLTFPIEVFEGVPATPDERDERLRTLYGPAGAAAAVAPTHDLLSGPEALSLQAEQAAFQSRLKSLALAEARRSELLREEQDAGGWGAMPKPIAPIRVPSQTKGTAAAPLSILALQKEVRRADGKRRIVPVALASESAPTPLPQLPIRSSSSSAGRVSVANASASVLLQLTSDSNTSEAMQAKGAADGPAAASTAAAATAAPTVATRMDESTDLFAGTNASIASAAAEAAAAALKRKRAAVEESRLKKAAEDQVAAASERARKRQKVDAASAAAPAIVRTPRVRYILPTPPRLHRWLLSLPPVAAAASTNEIALPTATASAPRPNQWEFLVCDPTGRAIPPATTGNTSAPASSATVANQCTVVSAFSYGHAAATDAASGAAHQPRHLLWESFLPFRVLLAKANSHMVAAACMDAATGLYYLVLLSSTSGRMLHAPVLLTAAPFALTVHTRHSLGVCLILACDGLVRVYDIAAERRKLLTQCSVRGMLATMAAAHRPATPATASAASAATSGAPATKSKPSEHAPLRVVAARLTATHQPCVVFSTRQTFVYDDAFESWSPLQTAHAGGGGATADTSPTAAAAYPASDMRSTLQVFERTAAQEERWLENASTLSTATPPPPPAVGVALTPLALAQMGHIDARTRIMHTISHLESALAAATQSGDALQYRSALTAYIAKLVALYPAHAAMRGKIEEICRELAGPASNDSAAAAATTKTSTTGSSAAPPRWQPFIMGLSKRALLSGLLPLLRTHGSLLATVAPHLRTNTNDATHRPTPTATNA